MLNTLIDAGPLIALFDKDDQYYTKVKKHFQYLRGNLVTTWPVIAETAHMLDFNIRVQIDFMKWLERGSLEIFALKISNLHRIIELSEKYADVPMDLADASLMIASEQLGITQILSLDSDYHIYRNDKKIKLFNLLDGF